MYKNLSLEKLWYTTCHAETFRRMEGKCHYQSFWWSSSYYFTCKTCGIWCWWNLRHMVLMKLAAYGVEETCGIWCWGNLRHMVLMKLAAYGVDETCGIWCWWNLRHMVLMKFFFIIIIQIFTTKIGNSPCKWTILIATCYLRRPTRN